MIAQENFTLSNGVKIPKLGLGTWFIDDKDAAQAVIEAVKAGYRHIDSAQAYGNEQGVGDGVRSCGLKREEIFVTTKLAAEMKSYDAAVASIDGSLQKLGLDHIDLMLIHSPQPWGDFGVEDRFSEGNREAWRALEDAYKAGKLRAIGISNFQKADIDNLLGACTVPPMVNQLLAHVTNMPNELIRYSQEKGMLVEAYSPMGHGELFKNTQLLDMAAQYGVSLAQLCIRYTLQQGLLPLPKTGNPLHMKSNAALDFVISDEDMVVLNNMAPIKDYGDFSVFPVYRT
ncbi:MAG: aldo/keto reductase [Sideroxydans sp.]|nr:aldo/keto reductase [Sideroxydans sp.]